MIELDVGSGFVEAIIRESTAQVAAIAVVDAAEHVQRTSVLVEAAMAAVMARMANGPANEAQSWAAALALLTATMNDAIVAYKTINDEALAMTTLSRNGS